MTLRARLLAAAALWAACGAALAQSPPSIEGKIDRWLEDRFEVVDSDSFIVLFDDEGSLDRALNAPAVGADRRRAVYDRLRARSRGAQAEVRGMLAAMGVPFKPLWIVNGLQVTGGLGLARALAARGEVVRIVGDPRVYGLDASGDGELDIEAIEWGIAAILADQVWGTDGVRGAGIVVASADTGVEWTHPALRGKYRGWNGTSASHDYNWHDAIVDAPAPLDDHNHGTHTVGTMVGDDGAGNQIGVAPDAKWIGCRNMDAGVGSPSTYLDCNQWFLAPWPHGGDPETDGDPSKAPDIVNNSWGCPPSEGCNVAILLSSFKALRAAGILAVAAAGNNGPWCNTVLDPPAIYEETFVVGATTSSTALASFSSRGSVTVDFSDRLRPDVAAPGSGVRSSIRGGLYGSSSGTSMASPHTAGAAALLWSAKPQVRNLVGITRCLLSRSANPAVTVPPPDATCGGTPVTTIPNNMFGWGLVNAYAAIHLGPDADTDGIADPCDCAPADGGSYDAPGEVSGLFWGADTSSIAWSSAAPAAGGGTLYDLVRGDLGDLRAFGTIADGSCVGTPSASATASDPELPPPETGFYYVVRARNTCGAGGWGEARSHPGCP